MAFWQNYFRSNPEVNSEGFWRRSIGVAVSPKNLFDVAANFKQTALIDDLRIRKFVNPSVVTWLASGVRLLVLDLV